MKYKVLLLSKGIDLSEFDLDKIKNKRIEDSVISSTATIEVLTSDDGSEDIDVFVGIGDRAEEARCRAQKAKKPSLLCDMDCSKADLKDIDATIPYTWGLFSKNNNVKEKAFLKHFNLSFVYDDAENIMDYIASLVFHMLEEFSYHSKYNKDIGYKKQAEFIHEFTQFYLDKMKKLVAAEGFVREDIKDDFYHIIYRYRPKDSNKPFHSIDGRDYDFVIEYHRGKPSEGIYYGIKGEVTSGDLEEQCEKFRKEWPNIFMKEHKNRNSLSDLQKATTDILNDTFLWKDFLKCFKPTDNFSKRRYWLFWITLNDDEDVISVAALAVKLISKSLEEYLWKKIDFVDRENEKRKGRGRPKKWDKKDIYLRIPYFSNEAYDKLCEAYYGEREVIEEWIEKLETNEIIRKENLYEKCYRLNIDSKVFIHDYVKKSSNNENIKSPFIIVKQKKKMYYYDLLDRLFLQKDGNRSIGDYRTID
ncbi:MAG: hypothetical protein SOV38_02525 [Prevotella sp.]|nr:hypothetical protein [Prevotella sp.]